MRSPDQLQPAIIYPSNLKGAPFAGSNHQYPFAQLSLASKLTPPTKYERKYPLQRQIIVHHLHKPSLSYHPIHGLSHPPDQHLVNVALQADTWNLLAEQYWSRAPFFSHPFESQLNHHPCRHKPSVAGGPCATLRNVGSTLGL